jgi:hypothetical protein
LPDGACVLVRNAGTFPVLSGELDPLRVFYVRERSFILVPLPLPPRQDGTG